MFAARDQNRLPAAPSVKIPTLSSPNGGTAVGSTYAPSLSLRRRFGAVPLSTASRDGAAMADLCVHECDVPTVVVESPPPQSFHDELATVAQRKTNNEVDKIEDVTPLATVAAEAGASGAVSATSEVVAANEFLLQKDEFLEGLVQRVRASCATVLRSSDGPASVSQKAKSLPMPAEASHRSPPPRRPSPTSPSSPGVDAGWSDGDGVEEVVPRARAPSRSRSRSPSPLSSPAAAPAERIPSRNVTVTDAHGGRRSSPQSPAAVRSGATSPDPRAPSTDLFAAGGAMRSSLQHSRCSGVSRSRRSVSAERADTEGLNEAETEEEEDAFWIRAGAASGANAGQRAASLCSDRASPFAATVRHPQWVPRPVPDARPAWNQRQPPKKQRPVVSAPGTAPPPTTRRSTSRSPERASVTALRSAVGTTAGQPFRRSASLPTAQAVTHQEPHHAVSAQRFSATAPRASARHASANALALTTQSPIDAAEAVTTSPPSPPSARALFQNMDVDSGTRDATANVAALSPPATTEAPQHASPYQVQALQQACDAAVARATRAERQCSVLTLALEQLIVEHNAEKDAWQARFAALEQQMRSVVHWIGSIDADANIPTAATPAPRTAATTSPTEQTAEEEKMHESASAAVPPLQPEVLTRKPSAWDDDEVGEGEEDEDAEISPLPGAPGATPTPARRGNNTSLDSRGLSSCKARLPPSPPMILHLHAQQ